MTDPVLTINDRRILDDGVFAHVADADGSPVIGPVSVMDVINTAVRICGGGAGHGAVTTEVNQLALALVVVAADLGIFEPGADE